MTASAETPNQKEKPRLALATATGLAWLTRPRRRVRSVRLSASLLFLSAVFFCGRRIGRTFSLHPLADSTLMDKHSCARFDIHDAAMWRRLSVRFALLIFLRSRGCGLASRADYSGIKDPQFVVIDEVAGST